MPSRIKAVLFDFMGTCLDWHSTMVAALPAELPADRKSTFALELRQAYFDYNAVRILQGKPVENFDDTQRIVLNAFLKDHNSDIEQLFTSEIREQIVSAWHHQRAWPDVADALSKLKHNRNLEIFVHANGSTRLQLDLVRSAGLQYDMLFSSELLGVYKPALESYQKMLKLLNLSADECVTVAAHEYDLAGARAAGMKTVYVYRWTDDIREDQEQIKRDNDAYLLDMRKLDEVVAGL